ncbi:DUF4843 domain-containing protein [Duncaniella freteri]|uniref:DUF4843 domain-containing protein n=1 Tax=Duncaniella freteri TaxID=2530391 RepID=UPI0025580BC6|nr:DUF4843 domain-containing protein [Duncaniella freteri]
MKKIIYLTSVLVSAILWTGCTKEDIDTYSGDDALFFAQQWGIGHFINNLDLSTSSKNCHQAYSKIGFGGMIEEDSLLYINIQTSGLIRDYDRPFGIEVVSDSTTAINGSEFELVDPKTDAVIPAGKSQTRIRIIFQKTERMSDENLQLQVRILPGEHFVLPFDKDGYGRMPIIPSGAELMNEYNNLNFDPSIHNIFINNFLTPPPGWRDNFMGVWSEEKFRLLLDFTNERLGWNIVTWNDKDNMWPPATRYQLAQTLLARHLLEQYKKGREYWVLDPDGTMMWVPSQNLPWGEDSRPENMSGDQ